MPVFPLAKRGVYIIPCFLRHHKRTLLQMKDMKLQQPCQILLTGLALIDQNSMNAGHNLHSGPQSGE